MRFVFVLSGITLEIDPTDGGVGALLLLLLFGIITAVVFAVKLGLDVAVRNKFGAPQQEQKQAPLPSPKKTAPPKKKAAGSKPARKEQYTLIPSDQLYIIDKRDTKRNNL